MKKIAIYSEIKNGTLDDTAYELISKANDIIKDMQEVVYQMKLDDIEENPDSEYEEFSCSSCAMDKPLAGSVLYNNEYRLCNDCVLIYETALKLDKIANIQEFMEHTEELRLKNICDFIKKDSQKEKN